MNKDELQVLRNDLRNIQRVIEKYKYHETHLEKIRFLKMIDAELLDALHNIEELLKLVQGSGYV
jgi:hypothetical protein